MVFYCLFREVKMNIKTISGTKSFFEGFCSLGNLYPTLNIPKNLRTEEIQKNLEATEISQTDNLVELAWQNVGLAFNQAGIALREAASGFER
jgi:hypothetical protein